MTSRPHLLAVTPSFAALASTAVFSVWESLIPSVTRALSGLGLGPVFLGFFAMSQSLSEKSNVVNLFHLDTLSK